MMRVPFCSSSHYSIRIISFFVAIKCYTWRCPEALALVLSSMPYMTGKGSETNAPRQRPGVR